MLKNKKAAMEMSVGTIVTIVLLMTVLVLGLVLIRTIFSSGVRSVNQIDDKVRSAINEMFITDDNQKLAIYPSDSKIKIKQGTQGEGFAFSVRNADLEAQDFKFTIEVDSAFDIKGKCKITSSDAEEWLDIPGGSFSLPGSGAMENPELVLYNIPELAPTCTIPYKIEIEKEGELYTYGKVYVTILPK